jgi:hypothetical protein
LNKKRFKESHTVFLSTHEQLSRKKRFAKKFAVGPDLIQAVTATEKQMTWPYSETVLLGANKSVRKLRYLGLIGFFLHKIIGF